MKRPGPVLAAAACLLAASCGTPGGIVTQGPPQAYSDAEAQFLLRDYRGALKKFEEFLALDPYSPYQSDARYWAGMSALKLGDVPRARGHVERAVARPRTPFLKGLCLTALGDCDFLEAEYRSAVGSYRRAMKQPGGRSARVLYQLGRSYLRLGDVGDAKKCFERVRLDFPTSAFAKDAKETLAVAEGDFAVQAGAFETRGNAEDLRTRLQERGFSSYLRLLAKEGKVLYSVRVGHFDSWIEANETAKRIQAAGFDAVVIP